MDRPSFDSLL
jgi:serine/threonine protein kinase